MNRDNSNLSLYWTVAFDLDCEKLREFHPKHNDTTPYSDLKTYFCNNGFYHHQGSVYTTKTLRSETEVYDIMDKLLIEHPWINECSKSIHLYNRKFQKKGTR